MRVLNQRSQAIPTLQRLSLGKEVRAETIYLKNRYIFSPKKKYSQMETSI